MHLQEECWIADLKIGYGFFFLLHNTRSSMSCNFVKLRWHCCGETLIFSFFFFPDKHFFHHHILFMAHNRNILSHGQRVLSAVAIVEEIIRQFWYAKPYRSRCGWANRLHGPMLPYSLLSHTDSAQLERGRGKHLVLFWNTLRGY